MGSEGSNPSLATKLQSYLPCIVAYLDKYMF